MNKMTALTRTVTSVIALMSVIALAGCANPSTSTPAATSSSGQVLADLRSGEKALRVGTDATFAPLEFTDESGQMIGFDVDLINAITDIVGIETVDFRQTSFGTLVPSLQSDKIDVAASAIYITEDRAKVIDFTDSYYPGGLTIMVNEANNVVRSPKDLAGKSVGVQVGTKSVDYLIANYPEIDLKTFQTNDQMFQSLTNGQSDAVVTGAPAALYYIKTFGGAKTVGETLTDENYGFGIQKGQTELLGAFNDAIAELRTNGQLRELEVKWFGEATN